MDTPDEITKQAALDRPLRLTMFGDRKAQLMKEHDLSLTRLAERLGRGEPGAPNKDAMPHIKLGRFSGERTERNALRSNSAHVSASGIEADYDAGLMTPDDAEELLRAANIAAVIYTSPSHGQPGKGNRWRPLLPFSEDLPPEERSRMVARLNGVLGGVLADESFTQSQSFAFGTVDGQTAPEVRLIPGRYIDLCDDLDAGAIGKPVKPLGEPLPAVDLSEDTSRVKAAAAMLRASADRLASTVHGDNRNGALASEAFLMGGLIANNLMQPDEVLNAFLPALEANGYLAEFGGDRDATRIINTQLSHGGRFPVDPLPDLSHLLTDADVPEAKEEQRAELVEEQRATLDPEMFDLIWAAPSDPSFGLTLLDPDQCASFKPAPYVAKGLIAQGDVACIVGAPGVGKTPAASEIAYCVSLGKEAFRMRTRQGGVLYLATENERDMRKRVTALRDRHGYSPNFHVVADCAGRFTDKDFLKRLKRVIAVRRPALIVVDTLGAAMPGFDENSSEGMGVVLAICQSLRRFGPAVLLVHHDTKGGDGLPRGHSSLNGALDMNLALKRGEDGLIVGTPSKNKNGVANEPVLAFRNKVVELGVDDDEDPITTVVAEDESPPGPPRKKVEGEKLSRAAKAALAILEQLTQNGDRPTTRKEWRAACLASDKVSASDKTPSRRTAFARALETLAQGELYTTHGDDMEEIRLVVAPDMLDPDDDGGETLL